MPPHPTQPDPQPLDVLAMEMDITTPATATKTPSTIKTPESDSETPARVQPTKPLSFTNGLLKRHHSIHHHHNPPPIVLIYKECLKNHAASLGGHALDGCGEFMPSPSATRTDPSSLKCAACGCHRNFHRREPEDPLLPAPNNAAVIEYQPHHRHRPPPPRGGSPSSPSPPPISSSYPASAPHMLLALSAGLSGPQPENNPTLGHATAPIAAHPNGRKRFRTKFTQNQKDKMFEFSERVGWKIQKRDEAVIAEFCSEIGVDRGVLKVWMHNNKSTFGKRDNIANTNGGTTTYNNDSTNHANNGGTASRGNTGQLQDQRHLHHNNDNVSPSDHVVVTNGSGSSSSS